MDICACESMPLAAVALGSPPRAAIVYEPSLHSSRYLSWTIFVPLPGVELGPKDNLPSAWCETGPQGPPPSLKGPLPSPPWSITRMPSSSPHLAAALD